MKSYLPSISMHPQRIEQTEMLVHQPLSLFEGPLSGRSNPGHSGGLAQGQGKFPLYPEEPLCLEMGEPLGAGQLRVSADTKNSR